EIQSEQPKRQSDDSQTRTGFVPPARRGQRTKRHPVERGDDRRVRNKKHVKAVRKPKKNSRQRRRGNRCVQMLACNRTARSVVPTAGDQKQSKRVLKEEIDSVERRAELGDMKAYPERQKRDRKTRPGGSPIIEKRPPYRSGQKEGQHRNQCDSGDLNR